MSHYRVGIACAAVGFYVAAALWAHGQKRPFLVGVFLVEAGWFVGMAVTAS